MQEETLIKGDHKMMEEIIKTLETHDTFLNHLLENQKNLESTLKGAINFNGDNIEVIGFNQKKVIETLEATIRELKSAQKELAETKEELKKTKGVLYEMTELIANDSLNRESEAKSVVIWNLDEKALGDIRGQDAVKLLAIAIVRKFYPEAYEPGLIAKRLPNARSGHNRLRLMVSFTTIHEKQMFLSRCLELNFRTVHGGKTLLQRHVANKAKGVAKYLNELPQKKESKFTASFHGVISEKAKGTPKMENSHIYTRFVEKPLIRLKSVIENTVPPDKPSPHLDDSLRISADEILSWYWSSDDSTMKTLTTKGNHNTNS